MGDDACAASGAGRPSRFGLRRAMPADACDIAEVHVASWRETYVGMLPDSVLDALDAAARARFWTGAIRRSEGGGDEAVFVAEVGDRLCGFVALCSQRDPALRAPGFTAEIAALYVLRAAQGAGVGSALLAQALRHARERDHSGVALWVLGDNRRAQVFYGRRGGVQVGGRLDVVGGAPISEIAYGWRSPRPAPGEA